MMNLFRVIFVSFIFLSSLVSSAQVDVDAIAVNLKSGEISTLGNPDRELNPASIWKVPVLFLAYRKLGKDFRFSTKISYQGDIEKNEIKGDVIIHGDGDPTLASGRGDQDIEDVYGKIEKMLRDKKVDCIRGKIILDLSSWGQDVVSPYWLWEDLGNYYSSGAWCMNYLDNSIKLSFTKGKEHPVLKKVYPEIAGIKWVNELTYGLTGSGDQAYVFAGPHQNHRWIRGTLPEDMTEMSIKGSMPNPPKSFLEGLLDFLRKKGIQVDAGIIEYKNASQKENLVSLGEINSSTLEYIISTALNKSDNLWVEAIARRMFSEKNYKNFLQVLGEELRKEFGFEFDPKDACGLSPVNRLSARNGAKVIQQIMVSDREFILLLPKERETSLRLYLPQKGAGHLKSGSMHNVQSYIGLWNNDWAFCVIHNGSEKRSDVKKTIGKWIGQL